jgi:hypothetical protein
VSRHSPAYLATLGSRRWRRLRAQLIAATGGRCERCRRRARRLELHHRHYATLGGERPADVELLCGICHGGADEERRIQASWCR